MRRYVDFMSPYCQFSITSGNGRLASVPEYGEEDDDQQYSEDDTDPHFSAATKVDHRASSRAPPRLSNFARGASFTESITSRKRAVAELMRAALTEQEDPMSVKDLYLVAIVASVGCATSTSGTSNTSAVSRSGSVLTTAEIAALNVEGKTAYDVVARLRPRWLAARGVVSLVGNSDSTEYAVVFVDGHLSGRLSSLRDIPAYQVDDLSYYDVDQARTRFGFQAGTGGAIEVRMKSSSRR